MLKAAEACHKGGHPFGIGLGETEDNVDTAGAIFQSYGADLVDAKGNITVKTDAVRQALEYYKKLAQFLPPDAPAWDNASNNKYLISGKGALIMNPPSAWAVAKRDAPKVAEQLWTHGMPAGPKGRYAPVPAIFLGHLELQQEQVGRQEPAASSLAAVGRREDGRGERRLRSAGLREADHAQGLGRRRARRRARSITIRTRTITRSCPSRRSPRRRRSPCRSIRRRSQPRWSCGSCRASHGTRPWPGPRARSKVSCGPELAPQ